MSSITLKPIAAHHLPHVQSHASHPSIGAMSTVPWPYPEDGADVWFKRVSKRMEEKTAWVFAITCDDAFAGIVSVNDIDAANCSASIDYWVSVPFQGRGVATRAVALALEHLSPDMHTVSYSSRCLARNLASRRVLEKNGFHAAHRGQLRGAGTHEEIITYRRSFP